MLLEDYWRYIFHTQTPWLWQGTWVFFFRRWRNRKQVLSKIYISSYEMFYDQLNQVIATASTTISPTQRRWCSSRLYLADTDGTHCCPPSPAYEQQAASVTPRRSHNTEWGILPNSHVWPSLQIPASSHCPDPELFPFLRCFILRLRLISSALSLSPCLDRHAPLEIKH